MTHFSCSSSSIETIYVLFAIRTNICLISIGGHFTSKGQIKSKADWRSVDSSKNKQKFLFFLLFTYNKPNMSISFWKNLWHAQTAFRFIWPLVWASRVKCHLKSSACSCVSSILVRKHASGAPSIPEPHTTLQCQHTRFEPHDLTINDNLNKVFFFVHWSD